MDNIILKGLRVFANHGVLESEKRIGQWFIIDVELSLNLDAACRSDSLHDTVNYADLAQTIVLSMKSRTFDLIEAAAQYVCESIFSIYPSVKKISLTLSKPNAPMEFEFSSVAVQLTRERN